MWRTNARTLVESLDDAALEPGQDPWTGSFEGKIAVRNIQDRGGVLRFDIIVPTHKSDLDDYIWTSERQKGTTEKVLLTQGATPVEASRLVAVAREGLADRFGWTRSESEQYRLTFEVPKDAIRTDVALELQLRWRDSRTNEWIDVAYARGLAQSTTRSWLKRLAAIVRGKAPSDPRR